MVAVSQIEFRTLGLHPFRLFMTALNPIHFVKKLRAHFCEMKEWAIMSPRPQLFEVGTWGIPEHYGQFGNMRHSETRKF